MAPLVSVMMPCFNGERTLPRALASLVVQTYRDWECVFVDDGSTDRSADVVEGLEDTRFRVIRLRRNLGRGAARQAALAHCSGELLGMLDADDWIYPDKLATQVAAMEAAPDLALVSTGLAIADARGELAGVRAGGPDRPLRAVETARGLAIPRVAFAPSMIRMDLARSVGFDPDLRACEDLAFLIDLLGGRRYAVLPDAAYVYTEHESGTIAKQAIAARMSRRVFRSYRSHYPVASRMRGLQSFAREAAYRAAFAVGLGESLIRRRSRPPTERERDGYRAARRVVDAATARLFPLRAVNQGHEAWAVLAGEGV